MMDPVAGLLLAGVCWAAGAVVSAALARNPRSCGWAAFAFSAVATAYVWRVALPVLWGWGDGWSDMRLVDIPALGAALTLQVDRLSALFLLLISTISLLTLLYSIG
jgi:NADH:ubiquinone oxidoreductase subunit 5 (subunit L)/multisubunit Na+/H+ antiporter MnhA subunit